MREVKHSALVGSRRPAVHAHQRYRKLSQFLPWCTHSKVQSRSEREIVATIGVKRGPLQSEFTTRNELEPDRRILMHLVGGPFRMLEGEWLLTPIGADGCRAELDHAVRVQELIDGDAVRAEIRGDGRIADGCFRCARALVPP